MYPFLTPETKTLNGSCITNDRYTFKWFGCSLPYLIFILSCSNVVRCSMFSSLCDSFQIVVCLFLSFYKVLSFIFLTKNVSCVFLITFLSKLNKNFKTLSTISISFTSVELLILQCRCTRFHCFRSKCDTLLLSVVHETWLIEAPVIFPVQSISW